MAKISPYQQAKRDAEKSKNMPVVTLKDMSPERREEVLMELQTNDYSRAKRRAEQARLGKR